MGKKVSAEATVKDIRRQMRQTVDVFLRHVLDDALQVNPQKRVSRR